jgi:4-methyl-5(b-hydroxyethyl)-thiazole monophosphate biosynthesis
MSRHVLVPVAQGVEEMETITIVDVLRRAGARVTMASVDAIEIKAAKGVVFKADALLNDCKEQEFDLIVVPGGLPGADNLNASKTLGEMLKKQAQKNKYYGAICASPAVVLHPLGLVTPGNVTCHPGFVDQIDNGNVTGATVVVDQKCITSRGGGTALEFALTLVGLLYSNDVRCEVEKGLAL